METFVCRVILISSSSLCCFTKINQTCSSKIAGAEQLQVRNTQTIFDSPCCFSKQCKKEKENPTISGMYDGDKTRNTCLSRFIVRCIMQQATWLNLMSPKQMTFGATRTIGHKFNRRKVLHINSGLAKRGFFVCVPGIYKDAASVPALKKPFWVKKEQTSSVLFLFVKAPHTISQTNSMIISQTLRLGAA